jgi:hypothetical protein
MANDPKAAAGAAPASAATSTPATPAPHEVAAKFAGDPLLPNPTLLRKIAESIAARSQLLGDARTVVDDWAAAFLATYPNA